MTNEEISQRFPTVKIVHNKNYFVWEIYQQHTYYKMMCKICVCKRSHLFSPKTYVKEFKGGASMKVVVDTSTRSRVHVLGHNYIIYILLYCSLVPVHVLVVLSSTYRPLTFVNGFHFRMLAVE